MTIINSLWIGKLSTLEKLSIVSHLKNGHAYHLWSYSTMDVPDGVVLKDARDILPESQVFMYSGPESEGGGSPSGFSNLFRYKLLSEIDEWWCDTDVVCLKSFDFSAPYVIATEEDDVPTTCVIRAPREIMRKCYEEAASKNVRELKWGEIGPFLFGEAIKDLREYFVKPSTFCPIHWQEAHKALTDVECDSYAVHLWNEMWRRMGCNKNATYNSSSLYERLKERYLGRQHKPMML